MFSLQQNRRRRGWNRFCLEAGGWGVQGVGGEVAIKKIKNKKRKKYLGRKEPKKEKRTPGARKQEEWLHREYREHSLGIGCSWLYCF
jgi:hypothetical protein